MYLNHIFVENYEKAREDLKPRWTLQLFFHYEN